MGLAATRSRGRDAAVGRRGRQKATDPGGKQSEAHPYTHAVLRRLHPRSTAFAGASGTGSALSSPSVSLPERAYRSRLGGSHSTVAPRSAAATVAASPWEPRRTRWAASGECLTCVRRVGRGAEARVRACADDRSARQQNWRNTAERFSSQSSSLAPSDSSRRRGWWSRRSTRRKGLPCPASEGRRQEGRRGVEPQLWG